MINPPRDQKQPDQEHQDQERPDHDKPSLKRSGQDNQSPESGDRGMSDQDKPSQESPDQDMSDQGNSELDKFDQDRPDQDPDYTPTPNGPDGSSFTGKRQDLPPRQAPMTEDQKKDLDREEVQDDYDMGRVLNVEIPSDPDHALLDELLEKDRGAARPVPTPETRYLSFEKGGSKKSNIPASSDPASKPNP
ncbi:hypothetical protein PHMEG_00017546 [Phytophthora megakarya]|uniref:Uncharacterized protein n=1 Tax=Phytophthora megakarya TaxID=4795 RepID=A0A225VXT4_9STRA|nr:hypothetical protein PHMEG_00017546 [Phytophthora megakarya]